MEKFEVTILGCGSALPTLQHNPSAQIVDIRGKLSLIDCGEGTQMQMRRYGIHFMKLRNIFISHLHGDHCFGLMGLISTLGLLGRTSSLHLYAPIAFESSFHEQMRLFCDNLSYEVIFHPVDTTKYQCIYSDRSMEIFTLPLNHRVPCCGFLFKETPSLPHINRRMIDFHHIPLSEINNIRQGADWIKADGTLVPNSVLTTPPSAPRSYAYCSDTLFQPDLCPLIDGVNTLYHEATYTDDLRLMAEKYYHSTATQAATIARDAHANQLIISHYSARYDTPHMHIEEAKRVFPATVGAIEGMMVNI